MQYYCTTNKAWLDDVNARNHPRNTGDGTVTWFRILEHPTNGEFAAELEERFIPRMDEILNEDELATVAGNLKTEEQMIAEGWFPAKSEEGIA